MHEATLYEKRPGGTVRCTACRHYCVIADKQTGICGVRQNVGGRLYLLVYGRAASIAVDPVEKKPLHHVLPGTGIFSLGTVGCNFGCRFCQNWDISQATREMRAKLLKEKHPELMGAQVSALGYDLPPERIVDMCTQRGLPSVAFTYNEPAIFFEYAYDTARLAHGRGIRSVFVSNGYETEEALTAIRPYLVAMNIDLKSFSEKFYSELCQAKLAPVLETIRLAHRLGIWVELTTLLIPGKNDSEGELGQIAGFIADVDADIPWHISAFHPDYKMEDVPATGRASLERAYAIGKKAGLRFVYVGNVLDGEHSSTSCPACGTPLIVRRGYAVTVKGLKDGRCGKCGERIPGVWS